MTICEVTFASVGTLQLFFLTYSFRYDSKVGLCAAADMRVRQWLCGPT